MIDAFENENKISIRMFSWTQLLQNYENTASTGKTDISSKYVIAPCIILRKFLFSRIKTSDLWILSEAYQKNQTGEPFVNCNFDKHPTEDEVCMTNIENLGNCSPEKLYGYNSSSPCVFLKLNRVSLKP